MSGRRHGSRNARTRKAALRKLQIRGCYGWQWGLTSWEYRHHFHKEKIEKQIAFSLDGTQRNQAEYTSRNTVETKIIKLKPHSTEAYESTFSFKSAECLRGVRTITDVIHIMLHRFIRFNVFTFRTCWWDERLQMLIQEPVSA